MGYLSMCLSYGCNILDYNGLFTYFISQDFEQGNLIFSSLYFQNVTWDQAPNKYSIDLSLTIYKCYNNCLHSWFIEFLNILSFFTLKGIKIQITWGLLQSIKLGRHRLWTRTQVLKLFVPVVCSFLHALFTLSIGAPSANAKSLMLLLCFL